MNFWSSAQTTGGNDVFNFLNLPVSARAIAMGGSVLSVDDNDLNLAIINPALISDTMDMNMSVNYINYFADINYGYVAFAKNITPNNNLIGGIHYLDYGQFTSADEFGNQNGSFSAADVSLNIGYERKLFNIDSNLSAGITLKTIYSNLYNYTSWASAVDIGVVYAFPKYQLNVAGLIRNSGFQWKSYTSDKREKLPFEMQLGFSKKLKHAPFRLSIVYENIENWNLTTDTVPNDTLKLKAKAKSFGNKLMLHLVVGTELIITNNFFIRVGYNYQLRKELAVASKKGMTGFSFGFGIRVYKFNLSYGRAKYSLSGASNNFSLTFDLNSFYKKKIPRMQFF
jgi:hypothetical protein